MGTEATYLTKKTTEEELRELKLAVKNFCDTIEMCATIEGNKSSFLKIQIESEIYRIMKSKI